MPPGRRHPVTAVVTSAVLIAGCGSAHSTSTARGTVAAFDADLAAGRDTAACRLLDSVPRAILTQADTAATVPVTCAQALRSPGGRRAMKQFAIPTANVAAARITNQGAGVVLLQSDKPLPVTYTLTRQPDRRWLITGF